MKKTGIEICKKRRSSKLLEKITNIAFIKNRQWLSMSFDANQRHRLKFSIFVITGTAALIALIASIFLAKLLPTVVFGQLGFVIIFAPLLSVVSLFGQNIWLLRLIRSNEARIRWKPLAIRIFLKSSGVIIVSFIIVFLLLGYSVSDLALILIIGLAHTVTYLLASCLRGLNKDILGLISLRLVPFFLMGIAFFCYLSGNNSLTFALSLLALGHVVQCIFAFIIVCNIEDGHVVPDLSSQTSSGPIFFYNMSTHLFLQSDRLICQIVFGFEGYAIYHAAKIIVRPINLVLEVMDYYSLPRLVAPPYIKTLRRIVNECILIAIFLGLVYLIWGNTLFVYFFGNKFGLYPFLILSLAFLELTALIQVPISNLVQASGEKQQLITTGSVGIATLLVVWLLYALISRISTVPMEVLPLCVIVAYIIRMVFILKSRGLSLRLKE